MKLESVLNEHGIGVGNKISYKIAKDANDLYVVKTRLMSLFYKKLYSAPEVRMDGKYVVATIDLHNNGSVVYIEIKLDDYRFPKDLIVKIIDDKYSSDTTVFGFSDKIKALNNALKIINANKETIMEILF